MRRLALLTLVMLTPTICRAEDRDAKAVAQEVLTRGASLFDTHRAASMAATYTDDARLEWVDRNKDTDKYQVSVKQGRSEIESIYADLFKDQNEATTSRNTVEYARFLAPDLLLITGTFKPDTSKDLQVDFVQERVKQGDEWLIRHLRVYIVPKS